MEKILVVDDEENIRSAITYALKREGYTVFSAANGREALRLAKAEQIDLVLLDRMLPEMDGAEVCRQLRAIGDVPIIMVTAKASELDTVVGLELGADDYVTKPFSMNVLLARIKSLLRRSEAKLGMPDGSSDIVSHGNLVLCPRKYTAKFRGEELGLTPKLFELLLLFMSNPGRVFTRDELLAKVWDIDFAGGTRTVDVHVNWLRKKLATEEQNGEPIVTIRGVGYKFAEDFGK